MADDPKTPAPAPPEDPEEVARRQALLDAYIRHKAKQGIRSAPPAVADGVDPDWDW